MNEIISSQQVRPGMFAVELDRPWLGTPFLLHDFLVENDVQIAGQKQCCETVT